MFGGCGDRQCWVAVGTVSVGWLRGPSVLGGCGDRQCLICQPCRCAVGHLADGRFLFYDLFHKLLCTRVKYTLQEVASLEYTVGEVASLCHFPQPIEKERVRRGGLGEDEKARALKNLSSL